MNSSPKVCDWILLGMETKNCFLNHSKPNTWAHQRCIRMINIKGQKFTRYMPSKCKVQAFQKIIIKVQAISSKYRKFIIKAQAFQVQTQAISSKYQKIIIKVQAHQVLSILNGPRRSKRPNFASLHIWFVTSWLSLKFFCLFPISMFLWILKIHVAFDVLCSCIYIFLKNSKKKIQDFQIFPKKREKFSKKKKSLD